MVDITDADVLVTDLGSAGNIYTKVPKVDEANGSCQNEGVTDEGVVKTAKIRAALDFAIMGINTATALKIAEMQYSLAKDYAKLAEEYRKYYTDNYQPIEKELITEAMKEPEYVRDKDTLIKGQMLISAKKPLVGKIENAVACTGRYCTGQRQSLINDVLVEQATVESLVCGFAHRYLDDEEITQNSLRWERRSQVLKIGRDIPTEAISYASLATGIFGSIGEQASKAAQGASWYLGHQGERIETKYPSWRGPLTVGLFSMPPTNVPEAKVTKANPISVPKIEEEKPTVVVVPKVTG